MKKKRTINHDGLIALGIIWIIVGIIIYEKPILWPLGLIFLLSGLIGKYGKPNKLKNSGK